VIDRWPRHVVAGPAGYDESDFPPDSHPISCHVDTTEKVTETLAHGQPDPLDTPLSIDTAGRAVPKGRTRTARTRAGRCWARLTVLDHRRRCPRASSGSIVADLSGSRRDRRYRRRSDPAPGAPFRQFHVAQVTRWGGRTESTGDDPPLDVLTRRRDETKDDGVSRAPLREQADCSGRVWSRPPPGDPATVVGLALKIVHHKAVRRCFWRSAEMKS